MGVIGAALVLLLAGCGSPIFGPPPEPTPPEFVNPLSHLIAANETDEVVRIRIRWATCCTDVHEIGPGETGIVGSTIGVTGIRGEIDVLTAHCDVLTTFDALGETRSLLTIRADGQPTLEPIIRMRLDTPHLQRVEECGATPIEPLEPEGFPAPSP